MNGLIDKLMPKKVLSESEIFTMMSVNKTPGWMSKPTIRLVIIIFWLGIATITNFILKEILPVKINEIVLYILNVFLLIILYNSFIKKIEKRDASELSFTHWVQELYSGFFVGAVLISITIITLIVIGYYEIISFKFSMIQFFYVFIERFHFAFIEELLFRLILFRLIEEMTNTKMSIIFNALIFGFAHYFNPNSNIYYSIIVSLEAGVLLSLAFIYTRRIWFPLGIHFGWNFFLGYIWGAPVSGKVSTEYLIQTKIITDNYFSGGSFGAEGSVVGVFLCVVFSYYLGKRCHSEGLITLWNNHSPDQAKM